MEHSSQVEKYDLGHLSPSLAKYCGDIMPLLDIKPEELEALNDKHIVVLSNKGPDAERLQGLEDLFGNEGYKVGFANNPFIVLASKISGKLNSTLQGVFSDSIFSEFPANAPMLHDHIREEKGNKFPFAFYSDEPQKEIKDRVRGNIVQVFPKSELTKLEDIRDWFLTAILNYREHINLEALDELEQKPRGFFDRIRSVLNWQFREAV